MASTKPLRWGSKEKGLDVVEFSVTAPDSVEEALNGEQDIRFEDETALMGCANGNGFVYLRRLALDDETLATQDGWTAENLTEFVRATAISGGKVRVRKPRIKPVKADKPTSEMNKNELAALVAKLVAAGAIDEVAA